MMQFNAKIDPKFTANAQMLIPNEKDMREMAIDIMTDIRQSTQAGIDVNGTAFAEYADSTKKKKIDLGRNPDLVDLTDRNRMLGQSMQVAPIQGGAKIFFADAQRRDVAMRHNYGIGVPQRTFFGVSKRSFDSAMRNLQLRIDRRAK